MRLVLVMVSVVLSVILLGWQAAIAETLDEEIQRYTRQIRRNPDNETYKSNLARAFYNRGWHYAGKGEYDNAIKDLNEALRLNPNDARAFNLRGWAYGAKGEYDLAIADYAAALRFKPDYAYAFINRGKAYNNKGEYDLAIRDFDEALRLNPNDARAFNLRGWAYGAKGEYDLAIADYAAALRFKPDDETYKSDLASAYFSRGNAYAEQDEYDLAIADYTAALRFKPDNETYKSNLARAFYNRGWHYAGKDEYGLAIQDYNKALRLNPDDAAAYFHRGLAYYNAGLYDLAIADFDEAIRLNPDDAAAYNNRGKVYAQKGWYIDAIQDYSHTMYGKRMILGGLLMIGAVVMALFYRVKLDNDEKAQNTQKALKDARDYWNIFEHQWKTILTIKISLFDQKKNALYRLAQEYHRLPDLGKITFDTWLKSEQDQQWEQYLASFSIDHAAIPNVGMSRKVTLDAYRIKTAADITTPALKRIPGFGAKLQQELLAWRQQVEQHFVYKPTWKQLNDLKQRRAELEHDLTNSLKELQTITQEAEQLRRHPGQKVIDAYQALKQAEFDMQ